MRPILLCPMFLVTACATVAPVATPASQVENSVAFLEANIEGRAPVTFLVDTGASATAIDKGVAARLSLPITGASTVEGSAGIIDVETARVRYVEVGGLRSGPIEPTVSDLSGLVAPGGKPVAGIMGYDVLKTFAIEFDLGGGGVKLAADPAALIAGRPHLAVPFTLDNNIPRVEVEIRGLRTAMRLDSGASIGDGPATFANIAPGFHARLKAAEPALEPYTHFTASGTGGTIDIPVLPGGPLTIGSRRLDGVRLIVQPPTGYFARPEAAGFLGLYSLKAWRSVIVDYPGSRILLVD